MRSLVVVSLVVAGWLGGAHVASGQASPRHHVAAIDGGDWDSWRGHDVAYLTAHLGEADRRTRERWRYDYVTVGSYDGPYRIWELTFVVRAGHIVAVEARLVSSVGCDIYE